MSGLCGWLGRQPMPESARRTLLGRMQQGQDWPAKGRAGAGHQATTEAAGLAVSGPAPVAACAARQGVVAALYGAPQWRAHRYGALASDFGHAQALLQAYAERGEDALQDLFGHFCLAVLDAPRRRALLAVDRFGVYPLCFSDHPRGLLVGSSVTSIQGHPNFAGTIDLQALYHYLYFFTIPAPRTIFREITKLRPAHMAMIEDGAVSVRRYSQVRYGEEDTTDRRERDVALRASLRDAVQGAIDGRPIEEVGSFLSGGLDSSTLTGYLSLLSGRKSKAFSVGFAVDGFDEMEFARTAAEHFGVEHHTCYVTARDTAAAIPALAQAYAEPFGNSSAVAAHRCVALAREHGIRTLLAGDGGDELFAGNERYVKQRVFERYAALPLWLRERLIEPTLAATAGSDFVLLRKGRNYVKRARIPLPERLEAYNYYYRRPLEEVFCPEVAAEVDPDELLRLYDAFYREPEARSEVNRMMYLDLQTTLPDNDLRKVLRTADMQGLAVQFPFLADEVAALAMQIPPRLHVEKGRLRAYFKRAMADFLPEATLNKQKHGFALPFGSWLREDASLRETVADSFAGLRDRGVFNERFLDRILQEHRQGHAAYYGEVVWVLTMLEQWYRHHYDGHSQLRAEAWG